MYKVMVLNLGATSTKVSIYEGGQQLEEKTIRHSDEEVAAAPTNEGQLLMRAELIKQWMSEAGMSFNDIDAMAMRGGCVRKATTSGTYQVDDIMRKDIYSLYNPDETFTHGLMMILPLLDTLLEGKEIPIYITDPPYVDEFIPEAKISGNPAFTRRCRFQALNHKQVGRQAAAEMGKRYEEVNLVVAHMGGGVSIGAHQKGRVIDCNDALDGDGPFSPERSGGVPARQLLDICYSGKTAEEVQFMLRPNGGVKAYLGTSDMLEVEKMAQNGDELADLVLRAFAYQVSKEIGACVAALKGQVDGIVLTGGIAYSKRIVASITDHVETLGKIYLYAGESEAIALVNGALRVLNKEVTPIPYG